MRNEEVIYGSHIADSNLRPQQLAEGFHMLCTRELELCLRCKMSPYGAIRLLLGVVLSYFACIAQTSAAAPSQAGFISIDCGTTFPYTDAVTGINWVPDTNFTSVGKNVVNVPGSARWSNNSELTTLRAFTDVSRMKYCYVFPGITPNATYMIRHTYWFGSYDGAGTGPTFYVNIDASRVGEIDLTNTGEIILYNQHIYKAIADTISFCLTRHPLSLADPIISSLELRPVLPGAYDYSFLDTGVLISVNRNYGGDRVIRFPEDEYDRIWKPVAEMQLINVTSDLPIGNVNNIPLRIPSSVLQTGQTTPTLKPVIITFPTVVYPEPVPAFLELYFAELDQSSTSRTFTIKVDGHEPVVENAVIKTGGPLLVDVVRFENWSLRLGTKIILAPTAAATDPPLINALTLSVKLATKQALTFGTDVVGLEGFKSALNLTSWSGDPCLPDPINWVRCQPYSSPRILSVNLSSYNLVGEIPADVNKITALNILALDNNALTGRIPDLTSLKGLVKLHLQNNKLSGPIPEFLGLIPTLKELYLQNNNFTGSVPESLKRESLILDVRGNPGLSDGTEDTGPVPPPVGTGASNKPNIGLIAGAAGGAVAATLVVGCLLLLIFMRKNRNQDAKRSPLERFIKPNTSSTTSYSAGRRADQALPQPISEENEPRISDQSGFAYTLHEVKKFTNNYSKKIGQGGFGSVYYGKLPNGAEVAVKVCDPLALPDAVEFNIEVEVLSRVHHRNLVSLVGYCKEENSQILIYEFLHKGTVQEHLYGSESAINHPLDWKARLYIALDAAQGLEYLHTGCTPNMIHRDIKSCNILLTDRYVAKVADFGLCKFAPAEGETHVSTAAKGTFGYLDPEYFETYELTFKSDVYSFGVFILELMSARKPIDKFFSNEDNCHIAKWAKALMNKGDVGAMVGSAITMSKPDMSSVWKVAEVAMKCCERKPKRRPAMSTVVRELREAIAIEGAHSGFDSASFTRGHRGATSYPQRPRASAEQSFSSRTPPQPLKLDMSALEPEAR